MAVCPRRLGAITAVMSHYVRVQDVSCRAQLYKEVRCVTADLIHSANRTLSPLLSLSVGDVGVWSRRVQEACTQGGALLPVLDFTLLRPQVNDSTMSCNELLQHATTFQCITCRVIGSQAKKTFFSRLSDNDVNEDAE